tara:strand:+ start:44 stop:157 length:114 start_codon:yes stop_codon:yes gene_type:complete
MWLLQVAEAVDILKVVAVEPEVLEKVNVHQIRTPIVL